MTYHKAKNTRPKSISSYLSKINQFILFMGEHKSVNEITDYDVSKYLQTYEQENQWTGVSYNFAKMSLNNLFKYLLINKHVSHNPTTLLERRRVIKTECHQVFTDEDFVLIMNWLRENDSYCLLFIQMIYYTCIRPKELRFTLLKFIDLKNDKITIPASISKNKKSIPVKIDSTLKVELMKLNIDKYPKIIIYLVMLER
ncbi:phage integrase N-terminal SAM-like domain-containing protein [Pedobacter steynii]